MGGARICFEGRRHERKERLLVPEGSLRWWEGRRLCLEERRHGRKEVFRARRTSLQTEGAPYLLRMMQSYAKMALFKTEGRLRW